jgi:protoheme IX farnesyltransferase
VGLLAASGGLLALNQVLEWELDRLMARTRGRPIPSGRLRPRQGLWFALPLFVAGVAYLWATVGAIPAALTGLAGVAYNFIYVPLKSRSYGATLTGAIPGAFPALVGWSAATGGLELGAWVLFGIAYLWQMPHVLGLAWMLRTDYEAAGFKLTPPSDENGRAVGRHMILFAAILLPLSLVPTLIGLTGVAYLAGAIALGTWLLWLCIRAGRLMSRAAARKVFLGSLLYQPLLLAIMLIDKA